jgi:tetratricopeptide (TPR) repeat protein
MLFAFRLLLVAKLEHDGDALALSGRHRESLRRFHVAAKRMPSSTAATADRVRILVKLSAACLHCNRPVEADISAAEAVALSPDSAEALRSLALAKAALGRHGEALDCVRSAIKADPTNARTHELAIAIQKKTTRANI